MILTRDQLDRLCQIGAEANWCHRRLETLTAQCSVVFDVGEDHRDLVHEAARRIVLQSRDPCQVAGQVALMVAERQAHANPSLSMETNR